MPPILVSSETGQIWAVPPGTPDENGNIWDANGRPVSGSTEMFLPFPIDQSKYNAQAQPTDPVLDPSSASPFSSPEVISPTPNVIPASATLISSPLPPEGSTPLDQPVDDPTIGSTTAGSVDYSLFNSAQADDGTKLSETANAMNWAPNPQDPSGVAAQGFQGLTNGNFSQSMTSGLNSIGSSLSSELQNALPFGSKVSASLLSKITGDLSKGVGGNGVLKYGVQLVSRTNSREKFFCSVMPRISESGSAEYQDISIAHHPGSIAKYITTPSRTWSIQEIKLVSLTPADATENQRLLNLIRSWRMPYYGYGTEADKTLGSKLGAPPEVLEFSAYGKENIKDIPVVISDMSWSWPNDLDYIHTKAGLPFPVIITIDLTLKEAWSPREFSGFDLGAYKKGDMAAAYKPIAPKTVSSSQQASATGEAKKGENGINPAVNKPPTSSTAAIPTPTASAKDSSAAQIGSGEVGVCTAEEAAAASPAQQAAANLNANAPNYDFTSPAALGINASINPGVTQSVGSGGGKAFNTFTGF